MTTQAEYDAFFSYVESRAVSSAELDSWQFQPIDETGQIAQSWNRQLVWDIASGLYWTGDQTYDEYSGTMVSSGAFRGGALSPDGSFGFGNGTYGRYSYKITKVGPDQYQLSGKSFYQMPSRSGSWFDENAQYIVAALGIAIVAYGVAAGAAAGVGAEGAGAGGSTGWISAEGGAGYAGGAAVDASALTTSGSVAATSGGWVSAEGGAGYSGGLAADAGSVSGITASTAADVVQGVQSASGTTAAQAGGAGLTAADVAGGIKTGTGVVGALAGSALAVNQATNAGKLNSGGLSALNPTAYQNQVAAQTSQAGFTAQQIIIGVIAAVIAALVIKKMGK